MSKKIKYIIFILLIAYLIFISFFGSLRIKIDPIFWFVIFGIIVFTNHNKERIKNKKQKLQKIIIINLLYLIVYFLSGLIFGYNRSSYNHTFIGIIYNFYSYIVLIFFKEYVRNRLIINKSNYYLVLIIFLLFDLNIYSIFNLKDKINIFKYIFIWIIPKISENLLLNYLTKYSGYLACLFYLIPLTITNIYLPILPSLDWFYTGFISTLLPFITYILLRKKVNKDTIKSNSFILIVFLIVFVLFIIGVFKYKPVAIASNSMQELISRGDIVIVKKMNKNELNKLKLYDIIEYKLDNVSIIHRIISIERYSDGKIIYKTKGDNNDIIDKLSVSEEQIIGKVTFKIPKLGYPSVLLGELLK